MTPGRSVRNLRTFPQATALITFFHSPTKKKVVSPIN